MGLILSIRDLRHRREGRRPGSFSPRSTLTNIQFGEEQTLITRAPVPGGGGWGVPVVQRDLAHIPEPGQGGPWLHQGHSKGNTGSDFRCLEQLWKVEERVAAATHGELNEETGRLLFFTLCTLLYILKTLEGARIVLYSNKQQTLQCNSSWPSSGKVRASNELQTQAGKHRNP